VEEDEEPGTWFSLLSGLVLSHSLFTPPLPAQASIQLLNAIRTTVLKGYLEESQEIESVCLAATFLRLILLVFGNNSDNISAGSQ
jgi:hypothetical protein